MGNILDDNNIWNRDSEYIWRSSANDIAITKTRPLDDEEFRIYGYVYRLEVANELNQLIEIDISLSDLHKLQQISIQSDK
jgi:hypothetical protein